MRAKSSDDSEIWNYAKDNGFTIISKDSDFYQRSILLGSPPKVIWLRIRNCTSVYLQSLLRARYEAVSRFVEEELEPVWCSAAFEKNVVSLLL
jgi:predicted nuclease of predicted toxin-antitoxin system